VIVATLSAAPGASAYEQEIKKQAEELAERIQRANRKRVAVVDFVDLEGNVSQLGRFLAEELSVTLSTLPTGLEVVDRNHLAAILKEKKLSSDGLLDPTATRRLGQILGVDVLVTGSLTPFGESVRVTAKALDANTAMMIAASRIAIAKVETINALASTEMVPPGSRPPDAQGTAPHGGGKTGSLPLPPPGDKGVPRPVSVEAPRVVEQNKFAFEIRGCELSGSVATCVMSVINKSTQRRVLRVHPGSHLYDDAGNSYKASAASLANQERNWASQGPWAVELPVHPNVPIKTTVQFSNLAPSATRAAALEVVCDEQGGSDFTVTFSDVPFVAAALESGLAAAAATVAGQVAGEGGSVGSILKGAAGDAAKKVLGKLFGDKKKDPPQEPQQ
jgi:TolB-like protein